MRVAEQAVSLRDARPDDHAAVIELCEGIWDDRDGDYLPRVYPDWIEGDEQRTRVAVRDGELVGIAQVVFLSSMEAWSQGMRVREDVRGRGIAATLAADLFDWAASQDALVVRSMVFSWNRAGMGVARGIGFEPSTAFRFARPEPVDRALPDSVVRDGDVAWQAWTTSDARNALAGLALDQRESWAMRELRPADLADDRVLAIVDDGIAGMAVRGRSFDSSDGMDTHCVQEYAACTWRTPEAAETLFDAIAADAADRGASETRVVVPENPATVSDAAASGVDITAEPHYVFSADVTAVTNR